MSKRVNGRLRQARGRAHSRSDDGALVAATGRNERPSGAAQHGLAEWARGPANALACSGLGLAALVVAVGQLDLIALSPPAERLATVLATAGFGIPLQVAAAFGELRRGRPATARAWAAAAASWTFIAWVLGGEASHSLALAGGVFIGGVAMANTGAALSCAVAGRAVFALSGLQVATTALALSLGSPSLQAVAGGVGLVAAATAFALAAALQVRAACDYWALSLDPPSLTAPGGTRDRPCGGSPEVASCPPEPRDARSVRTRQGPRGLGRYRVRRLRRPLYP